MPSVKVGDRVGAICSGKGDTIKIYGFGTFEGNHIPEEAVGPFAEAMRELKVENPRIRLDSGEVVYGCECWWGPENAIREKLEAYKTILEVSIDEDRKRVSE